MIGPKLPQELVSLICHIQLNNNNWWDKSIQQLLLSTLWIANQPKTTKELLTDIYNNYNLEIDDATATKQLKLLYDSNKVVCVSFDKYKLSECARLELNKDIEEFDSVEIAAKKRFFDLIKENASKIDAESFWKDFTETTLLPYIRNTGVRTYQLITGINLDNTEFDNAFFDNFLLKYPVSLRDSLRKVIRLFFDPQDANIRSFILRYLNAYFFIEASGLSEEAIQALSKATSISPTFKIFIDSNFLFSILQLHENPSNEAAISLIGLIKQLPSNVKVSLYITPETARETKNVLIANMCSLQNLRLTNKLADAASVMQLKGISSKYINVVNNSKIFISAEDYFDPYINSLNEICEKKGLTFYNINLDSYKIKQNVVDDINEQFEFLSRRDNVRDKTYEQLEHDLVLWHFVKEKRPMNLESPISAEFWIVTIDYRFLAFDLYKRKKLNEFDVPICIHPTQLIQMLQFWLPRSDNFEKAILNSIQMPFISTKFDSDSERITIKILEILSRYENIDDLDKDTIVSVLMNQGLRNKLEKESNIDAQNKLVKEELLEMLREKQNETIKLREINEKKEQDFNKLHKVIEEKNAKEKELTNNLETVAKRNIDLEAELKSKNNSVELLTERLCNLEKANEEYKQKEIEKEKIIIKNKIITRYFFINVLKTILAIPIFVIICIYVHSEACKTVFNIGIMIFLIYMWDTSASNNEYINKTNIYLVYKDKRNYVLVLILVTIVTIIIKAVLIEFGTSLLDIIKSVIRYLHIQK